MSTKRKLIISGLIGSLAFGGFASANAFGIGGGGVGGGGGAGGASTDTLMAVHDNARNVQNPEQGWGSASTDWFLSNLDRRGYEFVPDARQRIHNACNDAIARAVNRGGGNARTARVIAMQVSYGKVTSGSGRLDTWGATADFFRNKLNSDWNAGQNSLTNYTSEMKQAVYNELHNQVNILSPNSNLRVVCVAMNDREPQLTLPYSMSIQTDISKKNLPAGSTDPITDVIKPRRLNGNEDEWLSANVILHIEGNDGVGNRSVVKNFSMHSNMDVTSPEFTPADFGWTQWPAGEYWFDLQIPRQKNLTHDVDMPDRDPRESMSIPETYPTKVLDVKDSDALASGMPFTATISARNDGFTTFMLSEVVDDKNVFVGAQDSHNVNNVRVVNSSGQDVPADVTIVDTDKGYKVSALMNVQGDDLYSLIVPLYPKNSGEDYLSADSGEACYSMTADNISGFCKRTGDKVVNKVTPKPSKAWVLDDKGALNEVDVNHTNNVGADNMTFFPGDAVRGAVTGRISANHPKELTHYSIADVGEGSASHVDFMGSQSRVYFNGVDVTDEFTVSQEGATTVATAKPVFLTRTKGLAVDTPVTLVVPARFKSGYETNGEKVTLVNKGWERWNNEEKPTNVPSIFTWTPKPTKDVVGSSEHTNRPESIVNTMVFPGQRVKYTINLDGNIPDRTVPITRFGATDFYSEHLSPVKDSLMVTDSRTLTSVDPSNYTVEWDDEKNMFTVLFSDGWVKENMQGGSPDGWLTLSFEGDVKRGTSDGTVVSNKAVQLINNVEVNTNIPQVYVPRFQPEKREENTLGDNIDTKVVIKGDKILYYVTMDAGSEKNYAYKVHKLGMRDKIDDALLIENVKVLELSGEGATPGKDVTEKFNVDASNNTVTILAKYIEKVALDGTVTKVTEQPSDVNVEYDSPVIPGVTPVIDQNLLGKKYTLLIETTVKQDDNDRVIRNQAFQNFENVIKETQVVSNPVKEINPSKDVSIEVGSDSVNGQEIPIFSMFNYSMSTSTLPEGRAYPTRQWSIRDDFNEKMDEHTGRWIIVTNTDIYDGDKLVHSKGDVIAQSENNSVKYDGNVNHTAEGKQDNIGFFTSTFNKETGEITFVGTEKYFDLINSRLDLPQSWTLYTQMKRIFPGEVVNTFVETHNDQDRNSNEVVTRTVEKPSIDVEKFDSASGEDKGDRDTVGDALELKKDSVTQLTFVLTNTGNVPLKDIIFEDNVVEGNAKLQTLVCENNGLSDGLDVGEKVVCHGELINVKPGENHKDTAFVSGVSMLGETVIDSDSWHGYVKEERKLAKTGTTAGILVVLSGLLGAGGVTAFTVKRRRS